MGCGGTRNETYDSTVIKAPKVASCLEILALAPVSCSETWAVRHTVLEG